MGGFIRFRILVSDIYEAQKVTKTEGKKV